MAKKLEQPDARQLTREAGRRRPLITDMRLVAEKWHRHTERHYEKWLALTRSQFVDRYLREQTHRMKTEGGSQEKSSVEFLTCNTTRQHSQDRREGHQNALLEKKSKMGSKNCQEKRTMEQRHVTKGKELQRPSQAVKRGGSDLGKDPNSVSSCGVETSSRVRKRKVCLDLWGGFFNASRGLLPRIFLSISSRLEQQQPNTFIYTF